MTMTLKTKLATGLAVVALTCGSAVHAKTDSDIIWQNVKSKTVIIRTSDESLMRFETENEVCFLHRFFQMNMAGGSKNTISCIKK